jgi:hypothetical protein
MGMVRFCDFVIKNEKKRVICLSNQKKYLPLQPQKGDNSFLLEVWVSG